MFCGPQMNKSSLPLRRDQQPPSEGATVKLLSLFENTLDVDLKAKRGLKTYQYTKSDAQKPQRKDDQEKTRKYRSKATYVLEISTRASILLMLQLPMIRDESAMYSWVEGMCRPCSRSSKRTKIGDDEVGVPETPKASTSPSHATVTHGPGGSQRCTAGEKRMCCLLVTRRSSRRWWDGSASGDRVRVAST